MFTQTKQVILEIFGDRCGNDILRILTSANSSNSLMSAAGDTIYGGASGVETRLPIGSAGELLTVVGGIPAWVAPAPPVTSTYYSSVMTGGPYSTTSSTPVDVG